MPYCLRPANFAKGRLRFNADSRLNSFDDLYLKDFMVADFNHLNFTLKKEVLLYSNNLRIVDVCYSENERWTERRNLRRIAFTMQATLLN